MIDGRVLNDIIVIQIFFSVEFIFMFMIFCLNGCLECEVSRQVICGYINLLSISMSYSYNGVFCVQSMEFM